ncbi:MAG: vitamin K epoxide reductase family protein [Phycisphaerae bacterium]
MVESERNNPEIPSHEPATNRVLPIVLRTTLVLLSLFGWLVSVSLLAKSMSPEQSNNFIDRICKPSEIGAEDPCTSVLTSEAAYIRVNKLPPIPWAALGAGYFGFVGIWYLFVGVPNRRGAWWHMAILVVVLYGGFVSFQMVQLMATQLKAWCTGCVLAHIINAAIILLSLLVAWMRKPAEIQRGARPSLALAGATATAGSLFVVVLLLYFLVAAFSNQSKYYGAKYAAIVSARDYILWRYENEEIRTELTDAPVTLYYGNRQTPHVMTAFFDLQCTHCRDASRLLRQVVDTHSDMVHLVYRHFPLSRTCNPALEVAGGHNMACAAASATEAIRQSNGLPAALAFMDACYQRAPFFDSAFLLETGAAQGIARDELEKALEMVPREGAVRADIDLANSLKLTVPPIVFLDAKPLATWNSEEAWEALLRGVPQP